MMTQDDLARLASVTGPCLTIFQPLREDGAIRAKPETRVVAALQEAGRLLSANGMTPIECEEMLRPLLKVAANTDWAGVRGSLVMFRAPDFVVATFWPGALEPRVHFGTEFLVLPLIPELLSRHDFWLLALSINVVRLYRGSREGLVEVALPTGAPTLLPKAGETDTRDDEGNRLRDFFRKIDRGIHATLFQKHWPLILAGVAREVAIYSDVNTYSPLLNGVIHGNPDALGASTLYARASELLPAYSARVMEATARELEEAAGRDLVVTDPAEVIEAVNAGLVGELILAPGAASYAQREDLINWAALGTIRKRGRVSLINGATVTAGLAGILRFHQKQRISRALVATGAAAR
jgi:Bacterial archaeo-eukaryotic release factor family 3